jgi:hypothetical protein
MQESTQAFERLEEEIELRPVLESLARTFKLIDAEVRAVHSVEWERAFGLFRLLI